MSETAETEMSPDLRRLASGRHWFGYLTLENAEAVAGRIRTMLDGKQYTWVACNEMGGYRPEVRTGMRLREGVKLSGSTLESGRKMAHITVCDTYGVWGLDTTVANQREAHETEDRKRLTYLNIEEHRWGDRIEIEFYSISGNHIWWVATVEPEPDED